MTTEQGSAALIAEAQKFAKAQQHMAAASREDSQHWHHVAVASVLTRLTAALEQADRALVEKDADFRELQWLAQSAGIEDATRIASATRRAEAAITAYLTAAPPALDADGWRMVPVEPTREMLEACLTQNPRAPIYREIYRAMLAAAPSRDPLDPKP